MAWEIRQGDSLALLRAMPSETVQTVITSPPYWGLRDYGTGSWAGGDAECLHRKAQLRRGVNLADSPANTRGGAKKIAEVGWIQHAVECPCGARRVDSQLGLEATPEEYLAHMVEVFEEVRRVLTKDGTLWLNMGDCYARNPRKGVKFAAGATTYLHNQQAVEGLVGNEVPRGLKPKDLVGIPWRLAFALQAAGWYLRADIIWHKPNPMPESVSDRPTKAHEYIFLFSKSERYRYDAKAIMEPVTGNAHPRGNGVNPKADIPTGWDIGPGRHEKRIGRYKKVSATSRIRVDRIPQPKNKQNRRYSAAVTGLATERNKRSVWTIATEGFPGAHFATFPRALVEPCILAGSRAGDLVLDPFAGSGTVGLVALRHGRRFLGLELSPEYAAMARRRIGGPLFAEITA